MNKIDLTNIGGFPLEEDTLKFMQDSYGDLFEALARMAGNKTILSGVEVAGSAVSNGWIVYNGEIIRFVGGAAGPGVIIQEAAADALFEDGNLKPVYKTRTATIGAPADFPFSELVRVDTLAALFTKIKPQAGYVAYTGSLNFGDVAHAGVGTTISLNNSLFPISIPDQGSTNYIVAGSLVSQSVNPDNDNDVAWVIAGKANDSFQIAIREIAELTQNLRFEFAIIKTY
jgi:hypothetical protein